MGREEKLANRIVQALLRPVDGAWLAAFRVLYGLALSVSMLRMIAYGWVERTFAEGRFHFKYWGFEWVEALPLEQMRVVIWGLSILALLVAAGFAFRLTSLAFALGLSYVQLLDASTYLNHYYLATLLAWLVCVSPAARAYSADAWIRRRFGRAASPPGEVRVAAGWLYLFRFQVGLVYVFAGLAKFGADWLLHAQPLRIWLSASTDLPVLGPLLTIEWVPLAMSWAGFLFDTTIVAWLSFARTRPYAYAVVIAFHVMTRLLFPIGMFPAIMTLAALMFFSPSWPRRLAERVAALWRRAPAQLEARSLKAAGAPALESSRPPARPLHVAAIALGAGYVALQLVMPLRSHVYGGNVLWHEQGMRYSWRVMVRAKGGSTTFVVTSKRTGRTFHVHPRSYLTATQETEMSGQPDLILQLARHVRRDFERRYGPVEVHVDSYASLNGRKSARFIDPTVDLGALSDGLGRAAWVLPAPAGAPPRSRPVL